VDDEGSVGDDHERSNEEWNNHLVAASYIGRDHQSGNDWSYYADMAVATIAARSTSVNPQLNHSITYSALPVAMTKVKQWDQV
jgi:hypothetical protein